MARKIKVEAWLNRLLEISFEQRDELIKGLVAQQEAAKESRKAELQKEMDKLNAKPAEEAKS